MHSKTKKFYDKNALQWARVKANSFYQEKPFRVFEKLLKKNDSVLDIGCAYGIHVPLFLGIGRKLKYKGIDISKSMIALARSRYPQLTFEIGDAVHFKTNKKYDAFWSAATLMHVPRKDWPMMLSAIEKSIKKQGIGYITLPSARPNPASKEDQRHFELFDKKEFRKVIENRGWKLLKSGALEAVSPWNWYIVKLP